MNHTPVFVRQRGNAWSTESKAHRIEVISRTNLDRQIKALSKVIQGQGTFSNTVTYCIEFQIHSTINVRDNNNDNNNKKKSRQLKKSLKLSIHIRRAEKGGRGSASKKIVDPINTCCPRSVSVRDTPALKMMLAHLNERL